MQTDRNRMKKHMDPQKILEQTRELIGRYANGDDGKWFYANRFVFARLGLDERKTKQKTTVH